MRCAIFKTKYFQTEHALSYSVKTKYNSVPADTFSFNLFLFNIPKNYR